MPSMPPTKSAVVVGVTSVERSRPALVFGAAEAQRRQVPIVLLHAWASPFALAGAEAYLLPDVEAAEAALLADAADLVRELAPAVELRTWLTEGAPGDELARASQSAELVVVARHEQHRSWLGHVLGRLSAEAGCPVVSIPPGDASRPLDGEVVVGVDGSPCSDAAIGFAFDEADRTGSPLVAVRAIELYLDAYVPVPSMLEGLLERGRRELSESLAGWSEKHPDVRVQQLTCLGAPAGRLREAGKDARLVVVGSHGGGVVGRRLFGSVSDALLRDAPCPVAVVRTR